MREVQDQKWITKKLLIQLDGQPNVINKLVGIAKLQCNGGKAAMGLFACREIATNKVICPLGGERCLESRATRAKCRTRILCQRPTESTFGKLCDTLGRNKEHLLPSGQ